MDGDGAEDTRPWGDARRCSTARREGGQGEAEGRVKVARDWADGFFGLGKGGWRVRDMCMRVCECAGV